MQIKTPNASTLSNADLEDRIKACAEAAKALKAYRLLLSNEAERRGQRAVGRGGVRVSMRPAEVKASGRHG